jgi:hypothetical protein
MHSGVCLERPEIQSFLTQLTLLMTCRGLLSTGLMSWKASGRLRLIIASTVIHQVQTGSLRVILSFRSNVARTLLVPPAPDLVNTSNGVTRVWRVDNANLRIAILQLQELRHRDIETYAQHRGLGPEFVAHLRRLYDLRELVRRFFLLVKLCDLSNQIPNRIGSGFATETDSTRIC